MEGSGFQIIFGDVLPVYSIDTFTTSAREYFAITINHTLERGVRRWKGGPLELRGCLEGGETGRRSGGEGER